jgi:hypothetical protein
MRSRVAAVLAALAFVVLLGPGSRPASAISFSVPSCDVFGCQGSSVSLDVVDLGSSVYDVTLSIDTTGYTGSRTQIEAASFKAIQGFTSVTLDGTPGGTWSAPTEHGINNSLCAGDGNDFVCTEGSVAIARGAQTWSFTVNGGSLMPVYDWHIGFKYGPGNGKIVSVPGAGAPAVPEPTAFPTFAVGGLVIGSAVRRARPARD